MKKLCFILVLSLLCTPPAVAKDLVRSEAVNDNPIVGALLSALEDAQEMDGTQGAEQLLNQMLVITALTQAATDDLSEDDEQRAISILSAISNEVAAASSLLDETLASRIRAAITAISAKVSEDRPPPSDVIIEGRRAERIIRQGSILVSDSYIADDILAIYYLLVAYDHNLYACVYRHLPDANQSYWVVGASCAREGEDH